MREEHANAPSLTIGFVNRRYGIPKSTLRYNASKGYLKGFRDPETPKLWKFERCDVEAFVEGRK